VMGRPLWWFLQQGSTVLGALAIAAGTVWLARTGALRSWHAASVDRDGRSADGEAEPRSTSGVVAPRPMVFWPVAVGVTAGLVTVGALAPTAWMAAVIGVRCLMAAGIGLLAGALAVRLAARHLGAAEAVAPQNEVYEA
jgi:hypothetical protein